MKLLLLAQLCSSMCLQQQYNAQEQQVWQQLEEHNAQQRVINSIDSINRTLQMQQQQIDSMPPTAGQGWWSLYGRQ